MNEEYGIDIDLTLLEKMLRTRKELSKVRVPCTWSQREKDLCAAGDPAAIARWEERKRKNRERMLVTSRQYVAQLAAKCAAGDLAAVAERDENIRKSRERYSKLKQELAARCEAGDQAAIEEKERQRKTHADRERENARKRTIVRHAESDARLEEAKRLKREQDAKVQAEREACDPEVRAKKEKAAVVRHAWRKKKKASLSEAEKKEADAKAREANRKHQAKEKAAFESGDPIALAKRAENSEKTSARIRAKRIAKGLPVIEGGRWKRPKPSAQREDKENDEEELDEDELNEV